MGFIKALIESFKRYREQEESEDVMTLQPRRIFYLYCRFCLKANKLYDLASREDMEFCAKCKQKILV
jgi:hypothetical protein